MDNETHGPIRVGNYMPEPVWPKGYIAEIWMNPDGTVESTGWRKSQTDDQHHPEREKP